MAWEAALGSVSRNGQPLPEDVRYTESGATVFEHYELWDMPIAFFLLLLLFGAEWVYRRAGGLA